MTSETNNSKDFSRKRMKIQENDTFDKPSVDREPLQNEDHVDIDNSSFGGFHKGKDQSKRVASCEIVSAARSASRMGTDGISSVPKMSPKPVGYEDQFQG